MSLNKSFGKLPLYISAGVLSGALCWAGGYILPDRGWFLKIYPGLILGIVLFLAGNNGKFKFKQKDILGVLTLIAASVIGWRLAIDVGYEHGSPWRFASAGAIGAFSVAVGLVWVWGIRSSNAIGLFLILITAGGAFAGWFFRTLHDQTPTRLGDDLWTFLLFVEWQVMLMLTIWLSLQIVKTGRR